MATFKFHGSVNEVVPWQAQYVFPTQQTSVRKHIVKLPPKNGANFVATNTMRIEFPSDGYCNMLNSVLAFTLTTNNLTQVTTTANADALPGTNTITLGASASATDAVYNGHIISVIDSTGERHTYQIEAYVGATKVATLNQELQTKVNGTSVITISPNVRLETGGAHNLIQRVQWKYGSLVLEDIPQYRTLLRGLYNMGVDPSYGGTAGSVLEGMSAGHFQGESLIDGFQQGVQSIVRPRTFCLNLATGLASIKKLVPLKWMASQLALEITLAQDVEVYKTPAQSGLAPTLALSDVNFIAEMVDFDSTYDAAFYMGLTQGGGVPLKFSSWHYHNFQLTGASSQIQIHERSRSVKMAIAIARDSGIQTYTNDSGRFYHDYGASQTSGIMQNQGQGMVKSYWWRVGQQYYPSQPVSCERGGAEAYAEMLKCVDALGDYQHGSNIDQSSWSCEGVNNQGIAGGNGDKFCITGYFENTDVSPDGISGINAEEQSDLALQITCDPTGTINKRLDVFVAYDCMLTIGDNNSVQLVM